jgi:glycosyltransferase involved in cell wall biosynthesis
MLGGPALTFSARQKRLFWHIWQRRALQAVACVHVTALSELEDVRAFGLTDPVAVIPNGIDVPELPIKSAVRGKTIRQVLHLGRIHPKKGIDRLLRAWSLIDEYQDNWELRIIGPSEGGHTQELQALAQQLKVRNVHFEGPIYGDAKSRAYAQADLFILPTLHENFGMVVAEALAQGTPVISTKGAPWEGLISEHCGWWIEHGPEALAAAIKEAMVLSDEERATMGERGRDWMQRDFSWDTIAQKMESVYRWCAGQDDKPEFIIT